MNPSPRSRYRLLLRACLAALPVSVIFPLAQTARAQTIYDWTGATSGSITGITTNYSPNGTPGATDIIRFNAASYTTAPTANSSKTVGELLFDSGNTGSLTFGSGTSTLTLNGISGIGIQLNAGTGTVNTNTAKFALGASQSWLNNSTNAFTVGGTINLSTFALTMDGSGASTLSQVISGTGSLTKSGAGTLTLSGTNTYFGGTAISAGTVKINNTKALGDNTSAVTVASGAVLDLNGITMVNTNALTLNGTGISSGGSLTNSSSTAGTYAGLVTLGSDSSIIARGSGGITLSNTGTITGSGLNLTVGGANSTTIASIIGTSTGGLTKQDAGTLTLSGANTYTGATKINGGTLNLTGSIDSGSALEFGGGTLTYAPTAVGSTQTFNGTTVKSGGATINNATATNILNLGSLTHNAGGLLNVSSLTGTTNTSTAVDSTGIQGTWATTGSGTSLAYAAGGNGGAITSYTGGTAAATAASVTSTTGTVNYDVAAAGSVGANANVNTLRYTGVAGTIAGPLTTNGLMNAGTGTVTYSGNMTIGANKELVIVGNTQATTISGGIADNADGASGLTYGGPSAGKLTLSGGHTFTGSIIVNAGTLDLWNTASAYTNNITLATPTATLDAANTGTTVITINGNITGSGRIVKTSGVSTLVLNGDNDFTGGVNVAGTVVAGTGTNNGVGTGTLTFSSGSFRASDNNSRTFANVVTLSAATSAVTFGGAQNDITGLGDLTFTSTTSSTVGGARTWAVNNSTTVAFANNWSGNAGTNVTKAGTGTLVFNGNLNNGASNVVVTAGTFILNGVNAYTGTTTINAGTLLVNGSLSASSTVTVNAGTFGGSGTASGAATAASGSFLSAGASSGTVGTLTFGSTLDISGLAGGTGGLLFDLAGTGASDKITLTSGALSIGSGVLNLDDFSFTTLGGYGVGTYTLLSTSTSIVGTLGSNLTGTVGGLNGELSISGNDLVLTVSAIPEPATYAALAGLGVLGLAVLRRRRTGV